MCVSVRIQLSFQQQLAVHQMRRNEFLIYTVSQKKLCQCYFLNNSVKHWPTLIIFGMQHHKET